MTVTYLTGQVLDHVRALPDASVDLVTTSPPFLALRDYNGQEGQWGSEPDPASFLDHLLELTTELRRVLAPHGSIAIELGDTYSGSGGAGWPQAKSLTGTPTLFSWSLAYGRNLLRPEHTIAPWLVRNVIVWARNNPPVGALGDKVRPATSYITVACPSPRRWFDLDAVRVPMNDHSLKYWAAGGKPAKGWNASRNDGGGRDGSRPPHEGGSPPLDHWHDEPDGDLLWLINDRGSSLAHYAMWPPKLVERLILSMCPPGGTVLDPFAGTGTTLAVADIHGRNAIGIDLDPANPALYPARYEQCWRALKGDVPSPVTDHGEQLNLMEHA